VSAQVNSFVWKRLSKGTSSVRLSSVVQVVPSAEPENFHSCGSRSGTSLALVRR
jgi:hypothetical protein